MHSISDQERQQKYERYFRVHKHEDYWARRVHEMNVQTEKNDPDDEYSEYGPPDEYLPYAKHIDAMRVAVCYTGNPKSVLDANLKYDYLKAVLHKWQEGDSVLCLTDEDYNTHSGCFLFNGTSDDKYWVYQGREQTGDYIFKYTSDYYRHNLNELADDEYFKRMCPAEAMKLKRRPVVCRDCMDIYTRGTEWAAGDQCLTCDPVCHVCNVEGCICYLREYYDN